MYSRAEKRFVRGAGALVLGFVASFVGISIAVLLANGAGQRSGEVLLDAYVWRVARFTLLQAFLSTFLSVAFAIPVARALARQRRFPGRNWLVRLAALPLGMPALVVALGIVTIWGRQGIVNDLLLFAGATRPVSIYGLSGILIAHVFFNLPLATRLLLAGLDRIPAEYWLSTANLGMRPGAVFRLIEWPVLRQLIPGIAGLIFMLCVTSFTIVLTLGGGPAVTTIEVAIYQALRFDFDPPRAVLLSFLQILVTGALLTIMALVGNRPAEGTTTGREIRRFDAAGRRLADAAILVAFASFVGAPIVAIVVSGFAADLGRLAADPLLHKALVTSLAIAFSSGLLSLALVVPVIVLPHLTLPTDTSLGSTRFLAILLKGTASLILLVPPIVIATGWFLVLRTFGETGHMAPYVVVVINALMAMPFVVQVLEPAYRTHIARTARLALSLGVTGMHRVRWIDLPALKRPLLTAFAFAMALSLGDLGAIAIFGAEGFTTLPWLLFSRMGSYRTDDAAGIALVLGAICLLLVLPSTLSWGTGETANG
ncbi:thiamine/thiamine pyrophosphate ABC transporter permease [Sinorhizobium sp. BG8]|uniref:thiamine/thiamine pyrophosphate ABC transporter permease n=1 Tax=Sinorhizobium sp. BG8 TaxID=2613773 RepID=UPI00193CB2B3|nr:thiamine/thiamine pyrophosphate ABC transporter permease [Sinorhizobium sp. BG8]QRM53502.1 thiamine/thiamine pyrophosphate ABC transporter, permease protein [Sinorhizobium sp. BG8]